VREFLEGLRSRNIDAYPPKYGHVALASDCVRFLNQKLPAAELVEIPPEPKEDTDSQYSDSSKDSQASQKTTNEGNFQGEKMESAGDGPEDGGSTDNENPPRSTEGDETEEQSKETASILTEVESLCSAM
jgi:hypothetical protein